MKSDDEDDSTLMLPGNLKEADAAKRKKPKGPRKRTRKIRVENE